jgi:hypothetical protein
MFTPDNEISVAPLILEDRVVALEAVNAKRVYAARFVEDAWSTAETMTTPFLRVAMDPTPTPTPRLL